MAVETKDVDHLGRSVVTEGSNIAINIFYNLPSTPFDGAAYISNEVQTVNGVNFIENELGIDLVNELINPLLDTQGDLLIVGDSDEASRYSIDVNGDLIYSY